MDLGRDRASLPDARCGDACVKAVRDGIMNQLPEPGVPVDIPPREVGHRPIALRSLTPEQRRRIGRGPHEIGPDRAPGEQE